jgi:hypothetical protein
LSDWAAYERICGRNPLPDLIQALVIKERMEQFLPEWIKQQEEQIAELTRKMEPCAQHNGFEASFVVEQSTKPSERAWKIFRLGRFAAFVLPAQNLYDDDCLNTACSL